MQGGNGIELAVERGEIKIGEKAGDGSSKGNAAERGLDGAAFFELEANALVKQLEEIVVWFDDLLQLMKKKSLIHRREVAGDIAFGNEERRVGTGEKSGNFVLTAVKTEATEAVSVGVFREAMVKAGGEKAIEK